MSTEIWILLVFAAAAASALITFFLARRGAPTRKQLNDLETELETARNNAKQVEGRVSEHFERSAVLFGHLAKDYKAFLDHYSDSAQALGLSEGRARELLEQGYQPLLTHLEQDVVNQTEAPAASKPKDAPATEASGDQAPAAKASSDKPPADKPSADKAPEHRQTGESVARTEPPLIKDIVDAPPEAAAVRSVEDGARSARVVAVDLQSKADAEPKTDADLRADAGPKTGADPKADRQAGRG
ncbi:MAG: DUF1043 family protein [Pseudomonadales bacterium]|nr:DUF1043 family protein [Pseudomonadales bacterium]